MNGRIYSLGECKLKNVCGDTMKFYQNVGDDKATQRLQPIDKVENSINFYSVLICKKK